MPHRPRGRAPVWRSKLYVIQSGEFFKVGVARSIEARLYTFALYNPHPLRVALHRTVHDWDIYYVENRVHELLEAWAHGREWFTAPLPEIRKAVKVAMNEAACRDRSRRAVEIEALKARTRVLDVQMFEDESQVVEGANE